MPSPWTLKEVQSLTENSQASTYSLSKAIEKSLPFFKTQKHCIKKSDFSWTEEAEKSLKDMKKQMAKLPTLTAPIEGESLIMYLSAAEEAISAVLLAERGDKQMPITLREEHCSHQKSIILPWKTSNNEAKYEALLAGLRIAKSMGLKHISAFVDSKLVANQINNLYQAKKETMQLYLSKAKDLIACFRSFSITQVPRSQNKKADALSKMASVSFTLLTKKVLVEVLPYKSIEGIEIEASHMHKAHKKRRALRFKALSLGAPRKVRLEPFKTLVCIFGLLGEIILDNGKQSKDDPFKTWCEKLSITQHFAFVKHPQSNGLVERVNRSLGEGIKARLENDKKDWVEELPHVLWAHRTMIKSSNGNTPLLTYDIKAVIPVEIRMPSLRCSMVDKNKNDEGLLLNLDLLEKKRELAAIVEEKHKRKMERYYNLKVRSTILKPEDLVYRCNEANKKRYWEVGPWCAIVRRHRYAVSSLMNTAY
ncbi:reverse transcriptase domain-containing protein [Tanacetum coccineum]